MNGNANKERDPSKELEKLLSDVEAEGTSNVVQTKKDTVNEEDSTQKIDVLNLPPRKEVHSGKTNRMKIKVTKPYFRLIIVILLFLILFVGGFYIWGEDLLEMIQHI